jgi:integrase/recombinase XerD
VQKIVKHIANKACITQTVTPHILRHTFATLALQKGISLAAVQKILGHDRLATTAIYLNLTDAHVVEEFEKKW